MANPLLFTKRSREEFDRQIKSVANGLMLLSTTQQQQQQLQLTMNINNDLYGRVFECKTCNRQFSSFQALGGHRASHKRPRTAGGDDVSMFPAESLPPAKPKTHECSICGVEFAIGQALGGHMRRHRADNATALGLTLHPGGVPVVKKPSSGRRVLCMDLNLTPLENDTEFIKLGKVV